MKLEIKSPPLVLQWKIQLMVQGGATNEAR
jgi:hypothetical protein